MPIEEAEWTSISSLIELEVRRLIGRRADYFILTKVIKNDEINNNIWVKEFGDTPIPFFAFDYEVIYFDQDTIASGSPYFGSNSRQILKKYARVRPLVPKVGQTVLIAREFGADRLPRCLGVLRSQNFVIDEDDDDEAVV